MSPQPSRPNRRPAEANDLAGPAAQAGPAKGVVLTAGRTFLAAFSMVRQGDEAASPREMRAKGEKSFSQSPGRVIALEKGPCHTALEGNKNGR